MEIYDQKFENSRQPDLRKSEGFAITRTICEVPLLMLTTAER